MLELLGQLVQLVLALAMTATLVCVFLFAASMFGRWLDADSSSTSDEDSELW